MPSKSWISWVINGWTILRFFTYTTDGLPGYATVFSCFSAGIRHQRGVRNIVRIGGSPSYPRVEYQANQPTQSTMSSSEGEEFNMDVSDSESNYESEPILKKVGRLAFWLVQWFSHLFNRHPRKWRRCQNPSKAKCRFQKLKRNPLQRKKFSLITTRMLKTVQWMTSEKETRLITTNLAHHYRQLFLPRRRRQYRKRIKRFTHQLLSFDTLTLGF